MPVETLVAIAAILSVFGFFAAVVAFSDMTWDGSRKAS